MYDAVRSATVLHVLSATQELRTDGGLAHVLKGACVHNSRNSIAKIMCSVRLPCTVLPLTSHRHSPDINQFGQEMHAFRIMKLVRIHAVIPKVVSLFHCSSFGDANKNMSLEAL